MRDIELYRALLGLAAPWTVAGVDVDMSGQRVVVRVDAGPGPYPCPECRTPGPRYDSKPRRWRHLDAVHDLDRGRRAAGRVRHARGQAAAGAMGRAGLAVHRVVRAGGH